MSYIFYDTETTGKVTAFDQILQFAAIRTDAATERKRIASRRPPLGRARVRVPMGPNPITIRLPNGFSEGAKVGLGAGAGRRITGPALDVLPHLELHYLEILKWVTKARIDR